MTCLTLVKLGEATETIRISCW